MRLMRNDKFHWAVNYYFVFIILFNLLQFVRETYELTKHFSNSIAIVSIYSLLSAFVPLLILKGKKEGIYLCLIVNVAYYALDLVINENNILTQSIFLLISIAFCLLPLFIKKDGAMAFKHFS